ncbi:hypothetical protein CANTEDRAFT_123298 [Yamadazyma tenuis ATCC 10573]|nr:uncharacterized protein CANTEDRAFT_123298 [Yamadazyma tenuis ATCC 10573]EGV63273.1 hypothetical protein CANTEDRAFT_123298 [Yamadazyma tenuis ATCC 10573]
MTQLPIYQQLNHPRNQVQWSKLETWEDFDHNILDKQEFTKSKKAKHIGALENSVVSHTLAKPGGFLIKPVMYHNNESNEGVTIVHAGHKLCGYPMIVHGGILATILNETFKRNAALSKDTSSGYKEDFMVENLSIVYKFPSFSNQFLIIKTKKVAMEGESNQLVKLQSTIESENGKTLVKSEAILRDTERASISNKVKLKNIFGL